MTVLDKFLPSNPDVRHRLFVWGFRILAVTDIALAINYFGYRYTATLNFDALWFSIPLMIAETYAVINTLLFIIMLWKPTRRAAPPAPDGLTVDVFITTFTEPIEIVRKTAAAAMKIRYPHKTYVLDDGDRPQMAEVCKELGCEYITRGPEWKGRPRHAKAGNVNNALMRTTGDYILILDADQIPAPPILDHVLGYFNEPSVAFVQTPQDFYNIPPGDPFGTDAPLFYGPIMRGKDGWDAAFFCGSNAVLRREALFQLGLVTYVTDTEQRVLQAFKDVQKTPQGGHLSGAHQVVKRRVTEAAKKAIESLKRGESLGTVLTDFQLVVNEAQRTIVAGDLTGIVRDLAEIEASEYRVGENQSDNISSVRQALESGILALTDEVSRVAAPPIELLGINPEIGQTLQMTSDDALDVQPMATFSITEDMATAMRLHSLGWKSVFHAEVLARGLAPEDLGSALGQRLRWAAGTIQVFLRDNPLTKPGLTIGQRIQYFTTIYSYFSGFASVVFLISPIIYLVFRISPVSAYATEFLQRIIPYLLLNRFMFAYATWGIEVLRGEQYNMALFPVWIQATLSVFLGQKLKFQVTPKTRQVGRFTHLVIPQIIMIGMLTAGIVYGFAAIVFGWRPDVIEILINIFWAAYDALMLYVIVKAASYIPAQPKQAPVLK